MSVAEEIREQQKKALSEMNAREKLAYFWDYYKVHTIVVIIAAFIIATFVYQYATNRDYGFYAAVINADTTRLSDIDSWNTEFEQYVDMDTDNYQAYIDTSFVLDDSYSQYALANTEKLMAMVQTGTIDVIVTDTASFEKYAQNEFFMNLEEMLPADVYARYKDYLYYTDGATIDAANNDKLYMPDELPDPSTYTVNHRDPSTMKKPIPVGICLPEGNKIMDSGCFDYLAETGVTYQGYPSEAVFGIPVSSKKLDTVLKFLEFIEE